MKIIVEAETPITHIVLDDVPRVHIPEAQAHVEGTRPVVVVFLAASTEGFQWQENCNISIEEISKAMNYSEIT